MKDKLLLAGDVGGTKTILAVFSADRGLRQPVAEATYPSGQFAGLEELVRRFLSETNLTIGRASFGVAGPVVQGQATITNLPWVIGREQLGQDLGISSVLLVNDLVAIASAVPVLEPDDLFVLQPGTAAPAGAIAVIAPGTGLGEAFLTWDGRRYRAQASEGGHADFAPTNRLQVELLLYLQQRYAHVSFERVCSGKGLPNLYNFLRDSGAAAEPAWLAEELASADDPTPVILSAAVESEPPCKLCARTLELFVSILAAEAGNLALKVLSTGGVYLGGGIPPRILPALQSDVFQRAFLNKGRFSELLSRLPVYVIVNPKAALLGAAQIGLSGT